MSIPNHFKVVVLETWKIKLVYKQSTSVSLTVLDVFTVCIENKNWYDSLVKTSGFLQCVSDIQRQLPGLLAAAP